MDVAGNYLGYSSNDSKEGDFPYVTMLVMIMMMMTTGVVIR